MIPLIAALMACGGGPDAAALIACRAVPGLAVDEVGLALLEPVVVDSDLALWRQAGPTMGLHEVDPSVLAELRAATTCVVNEAANAGTGRWAVTVTRTSPTLELDGTLGQAADFTYQWQAVRSDRIRIETGLPRFVQMRRSANEALAKEDWKQVASLWSTIHRRFGDPLTAWDAAHAQKLLAQDGLRKGKLVTARFERVDQATVDGAPNEAVATVHNGALREIADVEVSFTFTVGEVQEVLSAKSGALDQGADAEVKVPIPASAAGSVEVRLVQVMLP